MRCETHLPTGRTLLDRTTGPPGHLWTGDGISHRGLSSCEHLKGIPVLADGTANNLMTLLPASFCGISSTKQPITYMSQCWPNLVGHSIKLSIDVIANAVLAKAAGTVC